MSPNNRTLTAAAVAAAGLMIAGGAAAANAATTGSGQATTGYGYAAQGYGDAGRGGQRAPHEHTAATADQTAKVKAAVTAKDSTITVTTVRKDPDGSFDALGTKAGQQVRVDVGYDHPAHGEGGSHRLDVDGAGPEVEEGRGRAIGHARVAISRAGDRALEQPEHTADLRRLVQGGHEVHLRGAGVGEAGVDALREEAVAQHLGTVRRGGGGVGRVLRHGIAQRTRNMTRAGT